MWRAIMSYFQRSIAVVFFADSSGIRPVKYMYQLKQVEAESHSLGHLGLTWRMTVECWRTDPFWQRTSVGWLGTAGRLEHWMQHDELHWLDIPQRVDYKLCVTVHRCLQHKAPPYLADLCTPVSDIASRQHLRSARSNQLDVPRHRRTQFGRRAFSVAGPMAWNALPDSIRDTAMLFQTLSEDSSLLLVLAHQRIRGFAFMRYIFPRLTLTIWHYIACFYIVNV